MRLLDTNFVWLGLTRAKLFGSLDGDRNSKMFCIKGGFNSFTVLKISIQRVLWRAISIVHLFDFKSKSLYCGSKGACYMHAGIEMHFNVTVICCSDLISTVLCEEGGLCL